MQGSFPSHPASPHPYLAQLLLISVFCFPGHCGNELVGENSRIRWAMAHITKANVCCGAAACAAVAEPRCKCYRDFQMRINGLALASVEENVLRVVVYYFCYSHCTCLLLPSVGIKLLALVLSLDVNPSQAGSVVWPEVTKAPEKCRCLKTGMPWNQFQRGTQVLNSQSFHSARNMFNGLKY